MLPKVFVLNTLQVVLHTLSLGEAVVREVVFGALAVDVDVAVVVV